jgi:hypothetical protein
MRIIQSCAWAPRVALHPSSFGHDLSFHGLESLLNSGHSRRPDQLACERQVKTRRTIGRSDRLMSARCLVSNSDSRRREFRIRHHPGVALRGSEIQKLTSNALAFSTCPPLQPATELPSIVSPRSRRNSHVQGTFTAFSDPGALNKTS